MTNDDLLVKLSRRRGVCGAASESRMFGYLIIEQHYYLWMGLCGGGSLIAGGLWLRKI
jgi:hypothetical protein